MTEQDLTKSMTDALEELEFDAAAEFEDDRSDDTDINKSVDFDLETYDANDTDDDFDVHLFLKGFAESLSTSFYGKHSIIVKKVKHEEKINRRKFLHGSSKKNRCLVKKCFNPLVFKKMGQIVIG